jgi:D-3-phosphoglycerate dehydrogenase
MMISRINDFDKLYFEPVGTAVIFIYKDRPGVIGQIGNALAEAGVNIDDMRNPHDPSGETSLAILRTCSPVSAELLGKIATKIDALDAICVKY